MKTAQEYISEIKANIIEVSTHDLLTAMLTPDVVIIDVREHEEFLLGHIEGAVNFPRGVLEMKIHEHPLVSHHCEWVLALNELAEKEIFLICRTGGRSALAADSLQNMGFKKPLSVAGGMVQWQQDGFPLVPYKV
ncbi:MULTISPECIES: rhodanese-like domain-containing protein [Shewanella]|uniref:rhodanese-like domain-containing protein n=1 Tax=Shewanella TaxID=22 RepID=UPI000C3FB2A8|nr:MULTISPECIES: rhodanese-like domain-containing protein [Shewanella]NCQ46167.1 rhodanese-like domain-containing protein [Shewanella frigidimarina]NCO70625.1 rhodanese-like domain-containing protein [Shewanella vesiculosa]NCP36303.1 rhodanese-like domain-containing protein [Shewanella vesiculosa]NCP71496.1 rhodanese-like domain-containing protein [Shewanella vesiculosa]NCP75033.1 rhodanese-like domain-containing protein [Shewanella vesiculosa]